MLDSLWSGTANLPGAKQVGKAFYELLSNGVLLGQSPVEALKAVLAQQYHDSGLDLYESRERAETSSQLTHFLRRSRHSRM